MSAYVHVEDSKPDRDRPNENRTSTWRCRNCRALVVLFHSFTPPSQCGKCKS